MGNILTLKQQQMKRTTGTRKRKSQGEVCLLLKGVKFDLKTRKKEEVAYERKIPHCEATFQINHRLYAYGYFFDNGA